MRIVNLAIMTTMILAFSFNVSSIEKIIYGEDDRQELFETGDRLHRELSKSTAAMIPEKVLLKNQRNRFTIAATSLGEVRRLCPSEPFREQPRASTCTGFLVAPDLLLSAGHCFHKSFFKIGGFKKACKNSRWVFDYAKTHEGQKKFHVRKSSIFKCKKIIARKQKGLKDYLLIKLDRPAKGRRVFRVRTKGEVKIDTPLTIIGHPSGLPIKIASHARVLRNSNDDFFNATLDSYSGNSGSPVINSRTGLVEGILTGGDTDYRKTLEGCYVSRTCNRSSCNGEIVGRITNVTELLDILKKRN